MSDPAASRARALSRSMRARPQHRAERDVAKEGRQHDGHGPAVGQQHAEHHGGHEDADEGRRDRVGEEVLDELDVVRRHAHQVARPPARQVRGRQRVERAEEPEPHVGQEPVRDVVGQPRLEPVEEPGEGRDDEEGRRAIRRPARPA